MKIMKLMKYNDDDEDKRMMVTKMENQLAIAGKRAKDEPDKTPKMN